MALTLGVLSATQAHALGGGTFFDTVLKPVGVTETNCNFNPYYDPGGSEAQVNFASGSSGGNYWLGGSIQSWGPGDILASEIATRCNITGITNYVSDGANGTYAADDFVGVSFTGQYGGQWYDYEIGVKGASGTQLVNSRVAATPPNTTPTADAGSAQTVASASSITLDGSGSDANDAGQSLTYAWTQTAGTSVTLSDTTAQSPSFTAPTVAIGASEMLTFQLIVHDGIEASPASTVTITVNGAANTTPTADAGSAQTVPSASSVTLDGSGSDANDAGQSLTYAWTQTAGTSVTLSDTTAQSPSFTAPTVAIGASEMLTFQLIVHDGIEASPASTVTITVNGAANTTPTADAGSAQTVPSASSVTLDGSGSDANDAGQSLTYAWTQTAGTSVTLSDTTAQSPSFTAPTVAIGASEMLTFQLIVNDGIEASPASTVTITVNGAANTTPTADAGSAQTVPSASSVTLDGSGSDANDAGQSLTYAWTQTAGTSVTLSDTTAQSPSFTAPTVAIGASEMLTFQLIVNDGIAASPASTVTITVNGAANTTPTADAGSAQTVPSASSVTLDGSGSDANDAGQSLTYAWTQTAGTSVTLSDTTAQSPSFTAPTVAIGASEMLTFQLIVNDGIAASPASTVTITVNGAANTTPTADAGSAQTVASASSVTLDGSGSDANDAGQSLTYAWTQTAGTSVTLSDTTAQSPSFTAPTVAIGASEMLTFQLIVHDGIEASPASTVTITVNGAANTTPTADAGSAQTVPSASSVTLDGSGSDANDAGQSLTYAWTQTAGTSVTLSDTTAQSPSFTAPTVAIGASEMLTFQLIVNDGIAASPASTVTITVNGAANTTPTADAGSAQTVPSASSVTLDGSGSDANDAGQSLTYAWTQTAGTSVTLSDTTAQSPSFTAPTVAIGASEMLTFQLIVNDGIEASPASTVTITVNGAANTTRPTVTLSGAPSYHDGNTPFMLTVLFSEAVTGFTASDVSVQNAAVTGVSGSGDTYSLVITPQDQNQAVTVRVQEDGALGASGNLNEASAIISIAGSSVAMSQEEIRDFMSYRAGLLVRAQPKLSRFLKPGGGSLRASATATRGKIDFSTSYGAYIWADGTALWNQEGDDHQSYTHLTFGSHFSVSEDLIIGAMVQFDWTGSESSTRDIESTGYLIGPYFAARLANQPLVFTGSLLHGRTENDLTLAGRPTDRFDSTRTLATLGVEGSIAMANGMTLVPSVDLLYLRDYQHAYTNSVGAVVPEQTLEQKTAHLGLDLEIPVTLNDFDILLTPGVNARFSDTDNGGTHTSSSSFGVEFGGLVTLSERSSVSVDLFYDGIGDNASETWGGSLLYELKF
ncbi:hypothetical protein K3X48_15515 (plasmid) [Aliiroseovarius crassostreae]|uniref:Autotransporter domain-containing protein n=1 Tax=Aliiroseovarius crassostreae TaxID=154981 RepID=A0A9Q9HH15_9RHOB|nr:Ig-like domain-containing protein [Aliiroseovarius crassostreae]UWP97042.1 hypothetical protein K3X48_15515 [Aliiroseovarius crassostreae]